MFAIPEASRLTSLERFDLRAFNVTRTLLEYLGSQKSRHCKLIRLRAELTVFLGGRL